MGIKEKIISIVIPVYNSAHKCRNFGMQLMEYGSALWSVLPPYLHTFRFAYAYLYGIGEMCCFKFKHGFSHA
ncbi:hypothetical protein [Proteiniphilum sp. X52]|uniref:hypothetical protein n=1 Tax=Proteiniphilum sp. X52 TaxID=2382159 RepID=UPI0011CD4164|nr:hypothetical protein [Proteiniphilum sp. X52]